jgi:hypothetical protein
MTQPTLASRPMAEAREALPWSAGGGGRPIPVRASDEVAGNQFYEGLGVVGKRFGVAGKMGSSLGDRYTTA